MSIEERRRQLGIVERPKVRAGAIGPADALERLEALRKRAEEVARAGSDPRGKEMEKKMLRRMGRR